MSECSYQGDTSRSYIDVKCIIYNKMRFIGMDGSQFDRMLGRRFDQWPNKQTKKQTKQHNILTHVFK